MNRIITALIRRLYVTTVLLLIVTCLHAQQKSGLARSAIKEITRQRWIKAEGKLSTALQKDSLNPFTHHVLALFYFSAKNPGLDLKKAYAANMRSARLYDIASPKARERLKKFHFDSARIHRLRQAIDSATFKQVKEQNEEQGYIDFISGHPFAEQRQEAIALRDEVAFLDAVSTNTYESFQSYLTKYPNSSYTSAARRRYDKLVFESTTRAGTLAAYENFLREHGASPFKRDAETKLFELYTLTGEPSAFATFITKYPQNHEVKRSRDILFHLLSEREPSVWPPAVLNDSLKNVLKLQQRLLVPVFNKGKFGFMDEYGNEIIKPLTEELDNNYICGNISEDVLVLPGRVIGKNGAQLFAGAVNELDDISSGFLLLRIGDCNMLMHKSGVVLDSCVQDARVVGRRFLSIVKGNKEYLTSFTGKRLLNRGWDEIEMFGGSVCGFREHGIWNLLTVADIPAYTTRGNQLFVHAYDAVRAVGAGLIWAKTGDKQAILNNALMEVIPLQQQTIQPSFFGFVCRDENGYAIYSNNGQRSSHFDNVTVNKPWLAISKDGEQRILDPTTHAFKSSAYDSLFFAGPFAIGSKNDSLFVHSPSGQPISFSNGTDFKFIPGKDSTAFLVATIQRPLATKRGRAVKTEEVKELYSIKGKKLFTEKFDDVQAAGSDLFILSRKEKKALIQSNGHILLPFEFDAIGNVNQQTISVLRSMKFGLYDIVKQRLIKPEYDKNVTIYSGDNVVAFRNELYGITKWDKLRDLRPEFNEVHYWNDSVALVKRGAHWELYDVDEQTVIESGLDNFWLIRDTPAERIAIVERNDFFGVLSSTKGTIIPITFSDLVNVGSSDEPVYFTEKHVAEASIFVVIYYDENGKMIRREIYDNPDDYEKIYCGAK